MLDKEKEIAKAYKDVVQARSFYQIKNFVIGQHHSPEMQYHQILLEAEGLIRSKQENNLEIKKLKAEIEELRATGKKSDAVEAEQKNLAISGYEQTIASNQRELEYVMQLFDEYPKYSRKEIESAQKDYWETRLTRVAQLQMLSRQGGVDWAQLEALQQANYIEQALNEIPTFNYITNDYSKAELGDKNEN